MNLCIVKDDERFLTDWQRKTLEEIDYESSTDVPIAGLEGKLAACGNQAEAVDLLAASGRDSQLLVFELPGVGHLAR